MTRSVEDIARGLEPTRAPRPIAPGERIHVVGAAGSAAAASLLWAQAAGAEVSGCDAGAPTAYSDAAEASGIPIVWRHDIAHVVDPAGGAAVDRIAVSKALTSVDPDQPELHAAHALGIPAVSCQQLIADAIATRGGDLLAVAGTHGKSTTTGWLVHLLVRAGLDPSAFVGAVLPAELTGAEASVVRLGEGRPTVVEADEYAGQLRPIPADDRGPAQRRLGPSRRVRDPGGRRRGLRGLGPAVPRGGAWRRGRGSTGPRRERRRSWRPDAAAAAGRLAGPARGVRRDRR